MELVETFGLILRRQRKAVGLTQEDLAFKAGVERNFVSLLERGINQPSLKIIFKLSAALDISPSDLILMVESELISNQYPGR